MEIYSIRSSQNLLYRNNHKSNAKPDDTAQPAKNPKSSFQLLESEDDSPDFAAISVREIREIARKSFDMGQIDHDTFSTLYEGLPTHAIDASGRVMDLSGVTDTTPFNFRDFYQNQLSVSASIGDPRTVEVLRAVVSFLNAG